ncbi:MAG: carboxylesterase/lipase family protein [Dehalococcoidia bacterium]|nr:carboxylesterase/lipase family protein [Dehalococcoidia bacterium]
MTIVQTTYGALQGIQREGHLAFMGIPYAAAPAGALRWRAPQPSAAWTGVRDANAIGLAAPQTSHPIAGFAASGPQDEDCLNLNVFTPAADGAQRPVLFWIHGGGFTHGAGYEPLYNGGPLATRGDVVVVTINYRLGALGYLFLGDILPGQGLVANAGQRDQVAALEWVRDNIAAFGGDPGNVTIFGESAGAGAVGTLLAMPAARGLFHKAILQSGTGRASDRATARTLAEAMLAELGLDAASAGKILELPAAAIVDAQTAVAAKAARTGGPRFGPVIDGESLPEQPLAAVRSGAAAGIPVIAGTNRDETKLFAATMRREEPDEAGLAAGIRATVPRAGDADAAALIAAYRASRTAKGLPATNLDIQDAIDSDVRFRVGAMKLALAQRSHQPASYVYLFTHTSPARRGSMGSCHALEMPFVFGTLDAPTQDRFAGTGAEVEGLSRNMMDAWLAFARTGNPAHEGIGEWPAYDDASRPTMIFDRQCGLASDPFGEERQALQPFV